jgi:hypothetical protein
MGFLKGCERKLRVVNWSGQNHTSGPYVPIRENFKAIPSGKRFILAPRG